MAERWHFRDLRRISAFVLTVRLGLAFAIGLVALLGLIYAMTNRELIGRSDRILAAETARLLAAPPAILPRRLANDAARGVGFSYAELVSADGERVAGNVRFSGTPRPGRAIEVEGPHGPVRLLATHTPAGETILVARDISQVRYLRQRLLLILGFSGVLALAGVGLAATLLARPTLRRVRELERAAGRIANGALQTRMPLAGRGDELDRLAATVNGMVEAVAHTIAQVKGVTDAVAHDLRTPLTRVRATLDHARHLAAMPPEGTALLAGATTDLEEVLARFTALLRIAEIEAGARRAGFRRVVLAPLLAQVRDLYEPLAEERGLTLSVASADGEIDGDPALLVEALGNLIDNAIAYASSAIILQATAGAVEVRDDGPGLAADEREAVRRRFHRGSNKGDRPGTGLGLSLVAAIAHLHGFEMELADAEPGLTVRLTGPQMKFI
jgi:signal transduction histidine kinase